jgi:siroheme synthase (precorrin-2 oxidase/ferrochelatase)
MRRAPLKTDPRADHVILVGSGEAAMAALWSLAAAGAHIHWYADRADVGAETVLAAVLGGARLRLSLDDPRAAPLEGAGAVVTARGDALDQQIAERARACHVPVHVVGRPGLPAGALRDGLARAVSDWLAGVSNTA